MFGGYKITSYICTRNNELGGCSEELVASVLYDLKLFFKIIAQIFGGLK